MGLVIGVGEIVDTGVGVGVEFGEFDEGNWVSIIYPAVATARIMIMAIATICFVLDKPLGDILVPLFSLRQCKDCLNAYVTSAMQPQYCFNWLCESLIPKFYF